MLNRQAGRRLLCFAGFLATAMSAVAQTAHQTAEVRIGDTAPPIEASTWLSGKKALSFEPGKVYVIEFWATWCIPCHAAMPHLNELVRKMTGRPVEFIAITSEEMSRVDAFLKTKDYKLPVAVDDKSKTFNRYGVKVLPHTVVIDTEGRIAAITRPEAVTEQTLEDLLAHKKIDLPFKATKPADLDWDQTLGLKPDDAGTLGYAVHQMTDATSAALKLAPHSGHIAADGVYADILIELAYGSDFTNTKFNSFTPSKGPYRVAVKAPDSNDETARTMLRELLQRTMSFKAEWGEVEKAVPVVYFDSSKATNKLKPSTATDAQSFGRHGTLKYTKISAQRLAEVIGLFGYDQKAIDATALSGTYDIDLTWVPGNKASLTEALAKFGLEVKMEIRKVRTLIVDMN